MKGIVGKKKSERRLITGGVALIALCAAAPLNAQDEVEDTIVVTGSRISTDSVTSAASPVVSIGGDDIRTAGQVDIGELLRESPALNSSLPANFSAFLAADDAQTDSDLGLGVLDLRNLGRVRTLVLVNGRRHVAGTQGSAAVDVNTIPSSMIERVETLTGGASSIYGSDAVSGVVNFVLRDADDFEGIEFRSQAGISDEGDAEEFFISAATGFKFADDRGSVVIGAEYLRNEEVFDSDRPGITGQFLAEEIENTPEIAARTGRNPNSTFVFVSPEGNPISSPYGVFDLTTIDSFGAIDNFISNNTGGTPIPFYPGTNIPILQVIETPGGDPRAYDPALFSNTSESFGVGDGLGNQYGTLFPKQDRVVLNANAKFEVSPAFVPFIEAKYSYTQNSEQVGTADFNDAIPIAYDNPFIPDSLAGQISELQSLGLIGPDPMDGSFYGFGSSRDTSDPAVLPRTTVDRQTFRIVGGFEGELPFMGGIDYELSFNYGKTVVNTDNLGTRVEDRFYAALDTVVDPATGEIVCRSDLDPSALPPVGAAFPTPEYSSGNFSENGFFDEFVSFTPGDGTCVPFNPFGFDSATQEYADWVYVNAPDRSELEQKVLLFTMAGDTSSIFELPAGPIGWAAGFEYREEDSDFQVSDIELSLNTWEGSRGTVESPLGGGYNVYDVFGEVRVPLLADLPFANLLEANASVRFADYNTAVDKALTYSFGGRWAPISSLTLRGTYALAIRSPNIAELFATRQGTTFAFLEDPCSIQNINSGSQYRAANCAQFVPSGYDVTSFITAGIPGVTGGNPNLEEETGTTFTVGAVYRPEGVLSGLQVIVDYYNIVIDNAIGALDPEDIARACVDLASTDNQFCPQITRDPTQGFITFHESGQINRDSLKTEGIDYAVGYTFDVVSLLGGSTEYGSLYLGSSGTRFLKFDEFLDPIDVTNFQDRLGELGVPKWIVSFNADWTYKDFSLGWAGRFESSQLLDGILNSQLDADPEFYDPINTGSAFVHDFTASYQISDSMEIYGGINNALDRMPFYSTLSRPAGPRGRFFFLGVQATF